MNPNACRQSRRHAQNPGTVDTRDMLSPGVRRGIPAHKPSWGGAEGTHGRGRGGGWGVCVCVKSCRLGHKMERRREHLRGGVMAVASQPLATSRRTPGERWESGGRGGLTVHRFSRHSAFPEQRFPFINN